MTENDWTKEPKFPAHRVILDKIRMLYNTDPSGNYLAIRELLDTISKIEMSREAAKESADALSQMTELREEDRKQIGAMVEPLIEHFRDFSSPTP